MFLAGTAVARRSAAAMVLTGAAATVLNHWIPVEERHLRNTCGAAYDEYAEEVPRWPIAPLHLFRRLDGQQFGKRVGS
jgi:protein-S-isoprenylcysteine O-methyltransferase Ste14